jgi:hypothetical protein
MYVFLLALGIVTTVAGMATIGFGIPIYEFNLGNALIIAGVTALVGGFVVIGLALAVAELCRIEKLLSAQQAQRARQGHWFEPRFPVAPGFAARPDVQRERPRPRDWHDEGEPQ